MAVVDLATLKASLPGGQGRLLALDVGTRTVGIAVSDPALTIALPVEVLRRTKFTADAPRLIAMAAERSARGLIVGMPFNMDGSIGPRAQGSRAFAYNLAKLTDLPIALFDERLSTAAATDALVEAGVSARRRASIIDAHAAAVILEAALQELVRLP